MNEDTKVINLDFVNAYLLKANDGYILIDTGMPMHWPRLKTELLEEGCLPNHLKLVVITHGDIDHAGNCAKLQKEYHAKIAIHAGDLEMVRTGIPAKRRTRGLRLKLIRFLRRLSRTTMPKYETFNPDIILKDDQKLNEYGLAAKVIHTPGHTKGSIAILTDDGRLFIGDTVSNRKKPAPAPYIENVKELHTSILNLKELSAHTIYPGHGKPFEVHLLASVEE